jgi:hypothetical protein
MHPCAVIDLAGWAGPCEASVSYFADLDFEINDEKVLQFLMVRFSDLLPTLQQQNPSNGVAEHALRICSLNSW